MQIEPLKLSGTFKIKLTRIGDVRGYFMRFYSREIFAAHNLQTVWEQESVSFNKEKNTLRGLHFQLPPYSETKLVRVAHGAIVGYFVDLRKNSPTYGAWDSVELSAENDTAIYLPKGFAHGFKTVAENTLVEYKIESRISRPRLTVSIHRKIKISQSKNLKYYSVKQVRKLPHL